ncbi:Cyclopropane fatty-acyl-phospholipid synthase and related methyltransferases (Cfa) (PDB:5Z9O) [Commensalibacter communis]|uniref:Cyclopropane fatty-acyl-phospholipid synthase and related methyltransferases (Cfa) n=1 Tax=Commensalibacter communis TaxID=2972786 RepID=A0A9W4TM24_9PROT|nr:cyclopropane-fatty-acyl-phospholipid synthase family protein [Commensalibacter communis]CAI3924258.1 Cyclopropane fatty-acyl-phospholipid synthase and related methyltransferases (Cfa) (PDB:5Z9O) [Commensalibacter communis]CAI3925725.1 Cyclopropane fatty-acyl-phospholipid synthase and related methyltransferases (Cfa) (PDB:5Z9O) [Commensalibacter communis]CAI3928979.1 Cyclopropane fatty-acyl-phospholipid synthase and related methyltransferases (Cfa) (PDB:5Z9O) [Commensalibacter communis]CAI393
MSGLLDAVLKKLIKNGRLEVIFPDKRRRIYGDMNAKDAAAMEILTADTYAHLLVNPSLAFGEGYMNETIKPINCSIYDVLNVILQNDLAAGHFGEKIVSVLRFGKRFWSQLNGLKTSRKNVAHHYDLSGALYSLFLDEDRQYSCAYFLTGNETLEEAQLAKKRHIASKLNLDRPGLNILDIGCGWGGMALFLAKEFDANVTGITLSQEQLQVAKKRAKEEGLEDKVRFELRDYRLVNKQYDRIVSVGMFEHVGVNFYDQFFQDIKRILKPDGVMLLHSIGRSDGPGSTNAWINKYIFPGGYSPSLSEAFAAIEKSGLWVTDCEILRLHYAKTLKLWRARVEAQKQAIIEMYDERFYRMFDFYLSSCELSFYYHNHMNFQLQISPTIDSLPITRDYMFQTEQELSIEH